MTAARTSLLALTLLALTACVDRTIAPYLTSDVSAQSLGGDAVDVLSITERERDERGYFAGNRGDHIHYLDSIISIPPTHESGRIEVSYSRPNPAKHFVIANETRLNTPADFQSVLNRRLAALARKDREVVVFVHGYNTSYSDGLFRTAQLSYDLGIPGVITHFSWPSAANPLGYSHDRDSVLEARDDLEKTLRLISKSTGAPIILVSHSMGGLLSMETLRQIEIATPGWSEHALGGVVLISPDISVDVFRGQASRFAALPQPFAIFTSRKDPALRLSAQVNGVTERLGNLRSADPIEDLPVTVIDVTGFSNRSRDKHFVAGTSPALISILSQSVDLEDAFRTDASGRAGILPGTALTLNKATQVILSPNLLNN